VTAAAPPESAELPSAAGGSAPWAARRQAAELLRPVRRSVAHRPVEPPVLPAACRVATRRGVPMVERCSPAV